MFEKSILVTGGAGFIGSNFIPWFARKYPQYQIVNLDKLTYAGNLANLAECESLHNYEFIQGDIVNRNLLEELFTSRNINGVIHFAAESHVDNSIAQPAAFIETNLVGTFTLLDVARQFWLQRPGKAKSEFASCRFHHVSTDEVYGSLGPTGLFKETSPYAPNSPYSASKAGADFLLRAWHHTYGLNVTTSNAANNYGPHQHSEKLIPKIVSNCLRRQPIPIYGHGNNVRDWLYVMDHCKAIDLIFHKGTSGQTYNIGAHNERTNLQVAQTICRILDQRCPWHQGPFSKLITFVPDRPGHDLRYALDTTKLQQELAWYPEENFQSGLEKTIDWILSHYKKV
ncbi:MAG: dTDP-glucose 4,6-dehydratase [Planctomycetia bacterium]|nr:dTDP-glucose 4,6-dehydratase [Planctomycetia bacterium]